MLRRLTKMLRRGEAGFTLIELMIVILVILILAAILVPQFGLAQERAKKAKCVSNQRNIETAVAMWETDNPNTNYVSGAMNLTATIPNGLAGDANNLVGDGGTTSPAYTTRGAFTEPDDTSANQATGADYWLAGGTPTNPSYGHVACRYAYAEGADPWIGNSGETEQGTAGNKLNHARGASASP
jgi:prepilin-type N-terminal cleavage/methylation domain-containing protein